MSEPECTVRLAQRRTHTATCDDTFAGDATVYCPLSLDSRFVRSCQRCTRFEREVISDDGQAFVQCRVPWDAASPQGLCGELMSPEVTCLDSELDAGRAVEFLEFAGVTSAPVLDDNCVLVGIVSATSLARIRLQSGQHLEVEDAMSTQVVTLSQQATLGEAARLMASRNVDRVPIVTDDGHLVGVISAMDLVRWLANRLP